MTVTLLDVPDVLDRYNEPHRYYHDLMHISSMNTMLMSHKWNISDHQWHLIRIAVDLHDAIYDPRKTDNEQRSAELVDVLCPQLNDNDKSIIKSLIYYTNPLTYTDTIEDNIRDEVQVIRTLDLWYYIYDGERSISGGLKVLKEYQFVPWGELIHKRNNFLRDLIVNGVFDIQLDNKILKHNIEFFQSYKPHIGVYAGSFNPFHIGHLSVLEQADKHFDQLIVAVPEGTDIDELYRALPFHRIIVFNGPLTDLIKSLQCQDGGDVTLIRGIRDQNDLTYEKNFASVYRDMGLTCDIMYLMTEYPHVSSTIIRSMINDKIDWSIYKSKKYDYIYDLGGA